MIKGLRWKRGGKPVTSARVVYIHVQRDRKTGGGGGGAKIAVTRRRGANKRRENRGPGSVESLRDILRARCEPIMSETKFE